MWAQLLLIFVTYCGVINAGGKKAVINKCVDDRLSCVDRAIAINPNTTDAQNIVNKCMQSPGTKFLAIQTPVTPVVPPVQTPQPTPSPAPSPSPSPVVQAVTQPAATPVPVAPKK